jgi:hypothetical protein
MDEIETVERMLRVVDAPVHVNSAARAGVALDRGVGIDDLELLLVRGDFEVVARNDADHRENKAPFGFQHFVQPQTWLCAICPLMVTVTGSLLHLHLSVPPAKFGAAGLRPESTAG